MSPKEIKKLAAACRAAGISHFKNNEVEFTLAEITPVAAVQQSKAILPSVLDQPEVTINNEDSLTGDELLFWSSSVSEENQ